MQSIPVWVLVAALVQGGAADDRVWPGIAARACGSEIAVVAPDGTTSNYHPPRAWFDRFEGTPITQGDTPRLAVDIAALFETYAATSVTVRGCDERQVAVARDREGEGRVLLVLTGRGTLKLIEVRPGGRYADMLHMLVSFEWRTDPNQD